MKINGAKWTDKVNLLLIKCDCGVTFFHRADVWKVRCYCGRTGSLRNVRDNNYIGEQNEHRRRS